MALDSGLRSPLVDLFVQERMPVDMRLLAASNQVSTEPVEQIALIAMHTEDDDPRVAALAWETWRALPARLVADVLVQPDTPERLAAWMSRHAAEGAGTGGQEDRRAGGLEETQVEEPDEEVQQLSSLPVPARIKLAMLGTREQRAVLVRDPNRVVSTAVLSSPKLSDSEVEHFARMTNVAADVLRVIGTNRTWLRHYAVVAALVRNPRTPPAISLGMVPRLQERELKALAIDRNVPEALRLTARKALATKESRRG